MTDRRTRWSLGSSRITSGGGAFEGTKLDRDKPAKTTPAGKFRRFPAKSATGAVALAATTNPGFRGRWPVDIPETFAHNTWVGWESMKGGRIWPRSHGPRAVSPSLPGLALDLVTLAPS